MNAHVPVDDILIVHDGRLPGGLGATAYARVLKRAGQQVEVRHLVHSDGANYFWDSVADELGNGPNRENRRLVLFGLTFLDTDPELCRSRIEMLRGAYADLEIWSHRWPDSYPRGVKVHIPPDDLAYGDYSQYLTPYEKQLLRLSIQSARLVPLTETTNADQQLVRLFERASRSIEEFWDLTLISNDTRELHDRCLPNAAVETLPDIPPVCVHDTNDRYVDIELSEPEMVTYEIPIIDHFIASRGVLPHVPIIAWLGADRILLYRRNENLELPSVRWLIENRYSAAVPQSLRDKHYGTGDAVYFPVSAGDRSKFHEDFQELATSISRDTTGGRFLPAGLSRTLEKLATTILENVDMHGTYTSGASPSLHVVPDQLYELLHRSSRTNKAQRTLTVRIVATTPEAVAFLFQEGGYNLQKIERLLEGAVTGVGFRAMSWLTAPTISPRLRIDVKVDISEAEIPMVAKLLRRTRMTSFERRSDIVSDDSLIGKFLDKLKLNHLVDYAESETIGPSVAHALALRAVADVIKQSDPSEDPVVHVLDLFSGSGVANRLLSRDPQVRVVSVDMFVEIDQLKLNKDRDGLWLKADARDVVALKGAILDRHYDVIGLDPPHSELVEILFGSSEEREHSLAELCRMRGQNIVMYQGHTTQSGRIPLVVNGLHVAGWKGVAVVQVEEELLVFASNSDIFAFNSQSFRETSAKVAATVGDLARDLELGKLAARILEVSFKCLILDE